MCPLSLSCLNLIWSSGLPSFLSKLGPALDSKAWDQGRLAVIRRMQMQLGGPRVARARSDADVLGSSAELCSRQNGDACELSERQKWSRLTTRSKARFYNKRGLSRLRATRHPNCQSTAYLLPYAIRRPRLFTAAAAPGAPSGGLRCTLPQTDRPPPLASPRRRPSG